MLKVDGKKRIGKVKFYGGEDWYNVYEANCLGAAMAEWKQEDEDGSHDMWAPVCFWNDTTHIKDMCRDGVMEVEEIHYLFDNKDMRDVAMAYMRYQKKPIEIHTII